MCGYVKIQDFRAHLGKINCRSFALETEWRILGTRARSHTLMHLLHCTEQRRCNSKS